MAPPFKTASVDIIYGSGVSHTGEVLDIASDLGMINKSGAWYSYKGEKIGQGRENAKNYLANNPTVLNELELMIRKHYNFNDVMDKQLEKNAKKSNN